VADLLADPWASLRQGTNARVGLGRAGDSHRLSDVLALQRAHALARDAVHVPLDVEALAARLAPENVIAVRSQALDRPTYLRRPDLGRRLDPVCAGALGEGPWDAAFIAIDGLSSVAIASHAADLFRACRERLHGWTIAPLVIATQGRVALGDEIGALLGASFAVVLIGERPGLSVADSIGIYVTYGPRVGRADSERNCISNIHPHGLPIADAAAKLAWLLSEARRRRLTGVGLKDAAGLREDKNIAYRHERESQSPS
jgi:ethanolamine ammonia-lyase small subunit